MKSWPGTAARREHNISIIKKSYERGEVLGVNHAEMRIERINETHLDIIRHDMIHSSERRNFGQNNTFFSQKILILGL